MSYVSLTDYFVAESLRHNPLALLAIRAELETRNELAVRARTVVRPEPTSQVGKIL